MKLKSGEALRGAISTFFELGGSDISTDSVKSDIDTLYDAVSAMPGSIDYERAPQLFNMLFNQFGIKPTKSLEKFRDLIRDQE